MILLLIIVSMIYIIYKKSIKVKKKQILMEKILFFSELNQLFFWSRTNIFNKMNSY